MLTTSWQGECWESSGGVFPVTSDSGQHDSRAPCELVDHAPKLTCVGGACQITPLGAPAYGGNAQVFRVIVSTPGEYEIRAEFVRASGGSKSKSYRVVVERPSTIATRCIFGDPRSVIAATLMSGGTPLRRGPAMPAMTANGVACTPHVPYANERGEYVFYCPIATREPLDVTVVGNDFSLTQKTSCE